MYILANLKERVKKHGANLKHFKFYIVRTIYVPRPYGVSGLYVGNRYGVFLCASSRGLPRLSARISYHMGSQPRADKVLLGGARMEDGGWNDDQGLVDHCGAMSTAFLMAAESMATGRELVLDAPAAQDPKKRGIDSAGASKPANYPEKYTACIYIIHINITIVPMSTSTVRMAAAALSPFVAPVVVVEGPFKSVSPLPADGSLGLEPPRLAVTGTDMLEIRLAWKTDIALICSPTPDSPSYVYCHHRRPHVVPAAPPEHCWAAPWAEAASFVMMKLVVAATGTIWVVTAIQRERYALKEGWSWSQFCKTSQGSSIMLPPYWARKKFRSVPFRMPLTRVSHVELPLVLKEVSPPRGVTMTGCSQCNERR